MANAETHFEQVPLEKVTKQIASGELSLVSAADDLETYVETDAAIEDLQYPQWQSPFREALLELDKDRLRERLVAAEAAILQRLQSLSQEANHHPERHALADALGSLRSLKQTSVASGE